MAYVPPYSKQIQYIHNYSIYSLPTTFFMLILQPCAVLIKLTVWLHTSNNLTNKQIFMKSLTPLALQSLAI
jgi:hypothetical protein